MQTSFDYYLETNMKNITLPTEQDLLITQMNGIKTLTMNRPRQHNALTKGLISQLTQALERADADDSVKVVVIVGAGPSFCSGHDLREIQDNPHRKFYKQLFADCSALMTHIVRLRKPVIAKVHGSATAAGCQLVASCDLAIASDNAKFSTPGVNIGLFCSTPMVALSRNLNQKNAMEMLLTGNSVSATRAYEIGLLNKVTTADQLDAVVLSFSEQIATKSPLTLAIGKEAFYHQLECGLSDAYSYTSEVMTRNMLTHDAAEGIGAFLEKRKPHWTGS